MKVLLFVVISITGFQPEQSVYPMEDIKSCLQVAQTFLEAQHAYSIPKDSFIQAACILMAEDPPA